MRLIDKGGDQAGVVPIAEALRIARDGQLDLVEVAAQAKPPVCRVMDYGKYMYQQSKREREARKKHKTTVLKEIRFRPSIEEHDYQVKLRQAEKFLGKRDKIKVTLMFRGREMRQTDMGKKVLERLYHDVELIARVERQPRLEGRYMTMILSPK